MSESLRTDRSRPPDAASDTNRDAKIEQLLLLGLDHYFAAEYEQAINVWTRALFLDRSHPRARAYIERARSALAERQRESEELLQHGVDAFQRGDGDEARRLLRAAMASGAPSEQALALLDRLNRLEAGAASTPAPVARILESSSHQAESGGWRRHAVIGVIALALVGTGFAIAKRMSLRNWRELIGADSPTAVATSPIPRPSPPLPRRGEMALARARTLAAGGHLRDALAVLEAVRPTDAEREAADRLKTDIQHQLLALADSGRGPQ